MKNQPSEISVENVSTSGFGLRLFKCDQDVQQTQIQHLFMQSPGRSDKTRDSNNNSSQPSITVFSDFNRQSSGPREMQTQKVLKVVDASVFNKRRVSDRDSLLDEDSLDDRFEELRESSESDDSECTPYDEAPQFFDVPKRVRQPLFLDSMRRSRETRPVKKVKSVKMTKERYNSMKEMFQNCIQPKKSIKPLVVKKLSNIQEQDSPVDEPVQPRVIPQKKIKIVVRTQSHDNKNTGHSPMKKRPSLPNLRNRGISNDSHDSVDSRRSQKIVLQPLPNSIFKKSSKKMEPLPVQINMQHMPTFGAGKKVMQVRKVN